MNLVHLYHISPSRYLISNSAMQEHIPMSFKFPPDLHGWITGSAKKMNISGHRFVMELVQDVKVEMDKPEGHEQIPKVLLKLRAMSKIEEAARTWRNPNESALAFEKDGDQPPEVRNKWSLSSQKPQEKQPGQNIREQTKIPQKKSKRK